MFSEDNTHVYQILTYASNLSHSRRSFDVFTVVPFTFSIKCSSKHVSFPIPNITDLHVVINHLNQLIINHLNQLITAIKVNLFYIGNYVYIQGQKIKPVCNQRLKHILKLSSGLLWFCWKVLHRFSPNMVGTFKISLQVSMVS